MKCRLVRYFRLKHGISTSELARHTGISQQRISQIELDCKIKPDDNAELFSNGIRLAMESRSQKLDALQKDFYKYKDSLMEITDSEKGALI